MSAVYNKPTLSTQKGGQNDTSFGISAFDDVYHHGIKSLICHFVHLPFFFFAIVARLHLFVNQKCKTVGLFCNSVA